MNKMGQSLLKGASEALVHAQGKKIKAKVHKVVVPKHVMLKQLD